MPTPERQHGPENNGEQPRNLETAPEILDKKAETAPETAQETEKNIENARAEVAKEAISGRETSQSEHKTKGGDSQAPPVPRSRRESYQHTMKEVRAEMSAPARIFSKVIHNPTVERTSEAVGSTVARPDALLSGSVFACVIVLGVYLLARYNGFALSGFETIAAFIIGWILGIIFDLLRALSRNK